MIDETLMIILRMEPGAEWTPALLEELNRRNRRLPDYKRLSSYLLWDQDFPRTASMKIKRNVLAEQVGSRFSRTALKLL